MLHKILHYKWNKWKTNKPKKKPSNKKLHNIHKNTVFCFPFGDLVKGLVSTKSPICPCPLRCRKMHLKLKDVVFRNIWIYLHPFRDSYIITNLGGQFNWNLRNGLLKLTKTLCHVWNWLNHKKKLFQTFKRILNQTKTTYNPLKCILCTFTVQPCLQTFLFTSPQKEAAGSSVGSQFLGDKLLLVRISFFLITDM